MTKEPMSEQRKGEIALLILKQRLKNEGVHLDPKFKRNWGNLAKEINVPFDEVFEFAEEMVRNNVDEMFARAKK